MNRRCRLPFQAGAPALLRLLCALLCLAVLPLVSCLSMRRTSYEGERKMSIEKSSLYRNGRFENSDGHKPIFKGPVREVWKEWIFGDQKRVPEKPLEVRKVRAEKLTGAPDGLRVTWLGHSSVIFEMEGLLILTDPVLAKRPSPLPFLGPSRYHQALPIEPEEIPALDAVIISHDHYDHLDYDTILRLRDKTRRFITPLGVGAYLEKWGIPRERITELDWWGQTRVGDRLEIFATPGQHFSGRSLFRRNDTLWASWVLKGKKFRLFFSGDSGYCPSFREIGRRFGPFDITLMENGQYNEKWRRVHMLPEESFQAFRDLRGKVMIPIHWGTYCLSVHDWYEPAERLLLAARGHESSIVIPRVGETYTSGTVLPLTFWWRSPRPEKASKRSPGSAPLTAKETL